jgi:hypothetical protein
LKAESRGGCHCQFDIETGFARFKSELRELPFSSVPRVLLAWPSARRKPWPHTKQHTRQTGCPANDNDGLAAKLRIIPLLDESVKRVHINMDDFSHNRPQNYTIPDPHGFGEPVIGTNA